MTSKMRSLRDFRTPIGFLVLLAAFAAAAGCSTAESPAGSGNNMNHILPSGSSVSGWLVTPSGGTHASTATQDYIANNGSSGCTQCHGSDLSGGISKVSCFGNPAGCHHDPVANWTTPAGHGATAKKAPGSSGFASCQICHGSNFSGGGANVSCFTCHGVSAPHPPKPWRSAAFTHTNTNTSNAPVCRQCHFPGSPNNPAGHPATPAPAGTAPGCFNSTLCHGEGGVPHPVGNPAWYATPPAAQQHGNSAKATPGSTAGFAYCQVCHGTGNNFSGGSSGVSCYPCHGASSPHPSQWRTGDTYVHTTTATGNATVCAFCHTAGANSPVPPPPTPSPGAQPDCFNNTLCHGAPHPLGNPAWIATPPAAQPHGNSAKATPSSTAGFLYCQACHGSGNNFSGGSSGVSCYPCHDASSPHPSQWRTGDTYVHTNTAKGNASVCDFCHRDGANSPIDPPNPKASGTPTCFNGTMCHYTPVPPGTHGKGWLNWDNTTGFHGGFVQSITCDNCHPVLGHPTCTTCHFDESGSRAYTPLGFTHDLSTVYDDHRSNTLAAAAGTVCENCHETNRRYRDSGGPSCADGGDSHPGDQGCHFNESLLNPVFANPRY